LFEKTLVFHTLLTGCSCLTGSDFKESCLRSIVEPYHASALSTNRRDATQKLTKLAEQGEYTRDCRPKLNLTATLDSRFQPELTSSEKTPLRRAVDPKFIFGNGSIPAAGSGQSPVTRSKRD